MNLISIILYVLGVATIFGLVILLIRKIHDMFFFF